MDNDTIADKAQYLKFYECLTFAGFQTAIAYRWQGSKPCQRIKVSNVQQCTLVNLHSIMSNAGRVQNPASVNT